MKYLETQDQLEVLLGRQEPPPDTVVPAFTIIYFTATWCGACKKLDMDTMERSFPQVNWLKCDVDQNHYSAGFCGVRSIPTFLAIQDKKAIATLSSNQNDSVADWIHDLLSTA